MSRYGWRCTDCHRLYQTDPGDACDWCGTRGSLVRFEHASPQIDVEAGDRVRCVPKRAVREPVVGTVVGVEGGRVLVRADDGTGLYRVRPEGVAPIEEDEET